MDGLGRLGFVVEVSMVGMGEEVSLVSSVAVPVCDERKDERRELRLWVRIGENCGCLSSIF